MKLLVDLGEVRRMAQVGVKCGHATVFHRLAVFVLCYRFRRCSQKTGIAVVSVILADALK
ncbi:hypothetical protein [Actinomyces trachealis]|uniref:hypothetical protein n=1 Tax=Actinomyces trachealis TaxID=2763540 RepID=UPI0018C62207|nr:hypothetical protein [Actinomyces trachealis]